MKIFQSLLFLLVFTFVFEISSINRADAAACTVTDGVYSEAEIKSGCEATPDLYEIVIYKMYLCTSAPTIPTTSAQVVLTNCSQVFNNASGATASVAGTDAGIELEGDYTKPPAGTYTRIRNDEQYFWYYSVN